MSVHENCNYPCSKPCSTPTHIMILQFLFALLQWRIINSCQPESQWLYEFIIFIKMPIYVYEWINSFFMYAYLEIIEAIRDWDQLPRWPFPFYPIVAIYRSWPIALAICADLIRYDGRCSLGNHVGEHGYRKNDGGLLLNIEQRFIWAPVVFTQFFYFDGSVTYLM